QNKTDSKQQYASIGDFPLENGKQIVDCKIGYRTFGKLNANRTNAVIYPTSGGMTTYMMQLFGAGSEVDTIRYYLILIDALGNGASSSPSNSISQPKTLFPQFNIRDMVNTQYKMLTDKMNIHHLAVIIGGSMGGLQALQWAISYPDFMDKVVCIETTPKLSSYDLLWMNTYLESVKSDTAYHDGNYKINPVTPLAVHLMQLLLTTPAILNKTVSVDNFPTLLASLSKPNPFSVDCNNFIWQTNAVMMHDISSKAGGSLENAAKTIKANMLIIANKQDHIINQSLAIQFADMAKAEIVIMDDDLGHLIFNQEKVVEATRKFLAQ
ncbi:MAG TPA: alpha/beta fold hydrolase, partial [Saprospiraceae bacterium]|nr:alpha/beta fold hydrolase [Saprospiraceae bacterium]